MAPLAGRTALITGASSGIGRAIAERLARDGARVAVVYRSGSAAAQAVVDAILSAGGAAAAFACDVSDSAAVRELFATVSAQFGVPDILVNAAGIFMERQTVENLEDAVLERLMRVNLFGPVYCCREFIRGRRAAGGGGRILNISSGAQYTPGPFISPYSMSKAALGSLTRSLSREVIELGITVNAVAPGFTATPLNAEFRAQPGTAERLATSIPLGRPGKPEEIAAMVALIVSDEGAYMTGQTVVIDGGLMMKWGGI